jgi:hypothetical protein
MSCSTVFIFGFLSQSLWRLHRGRLQEAGRAERG